MCMVLGDWGPSPELLGPIAALSETGFGPTKFSNDFIDLLLEQMQSCKGYICSIFLQSDLSNVVQIICCNRCKIT